MRRELWGIAAAAAVAAAAWGSSPKIWVTSSAAEFSGGKSHGVSADPDGFLSLTWRPERVEGLSGASLLCAARLPSGALVFGTGDDGKIYRQVPGGRAELLVSLPENFVTAIAAAPDGSLFAATSPDGKVYRIAEGKASVFFDPPEEYLWALAPGERGELFVGTGLPGKIYRVTGAGRGSVLFDPQDEHVRCLLRDARGRLWAGTSGRGLVLRVEPSGRAATIYDSQKTEISSLAEGADGRIYASAVSGRMPLPPPVVAKPPSRPAEKEPKREPGGGDDEPSVTVTVTTSTEPATPAVAAGPSPKGGVSSEVVQIDPDGAVTPLWSSSNEIVYSLLAANPAGGVLAGTGPSGKVYRIDEEGSALEETFDEKRVVALLPGAALTDSASSAYRRVPALEGEYFSSIKDTGRPSRFGAFRRTASVPKGASLAFAFRSGNAAVPDATWSAWSDPVTAQEASAIPAPAGRFLQWKATLTRGGGGAGSARISRVECAYQNENVAPRIETFAGAGTGAWEGLTGPASDSSERSAGADSIFAGPEFRPMAGNRSRPAGAGTTTLAWKASDPDGDPLVFDIDFRPEGASKWIPLRRGIKGSTFSFDSALLSDGDYRFRLTASDREANPESPRTAERVSEPVRVDDTPPEIRVVSRRREGGKDVVRLRVRDASSPLALVAWSLDAAPWTVAVPDDGMTDSPEESYTISLSPESRGAYLLIRAADAAGNAASASITAP
jgi:hypothetical protein